MRWPAQRLSSALLAAIPETTLPPGTAGGSQADTLRLCSHSCQQRQRLESESCEEPISIVGAPENGCNSLGGHSDDTSIRAIRPRASYPLRLAGEIEGDEQSTVQLGHGLW
jgi:hypothetical protein